MIHIVPVVCLFAPVFHPPYRHGGNLLQLFITLCQLLLLYTVISFRACFRPLRFLISSELIGRFRLLN